MINRSRFFSFQIDCSIIYANGIDSGLLLLLHYDSDVTVRLLPLLRFAGDSSNECWSFVTNHICSWCKKTIRDEDCVTANLSVLIDRDSGKGRVFLWEIRRYERKWPVALRGEGGGGALMTIGYRPMKNKMTDTWRTKAFLIVMFLFDFSFWKQTRGWKLAEVSNTLIIF